MAITVNLRHLEAHNKRLTGELPVEELDLDIRDELIQARRPLEYDLEVQKLEDGLLVQGKLRLFLDCQCVRCLKPVPHLVQLDPWTCHLPLQGEERVEVTNDLVDLTPSIREDILLEFPQHPLCDPECGGLPNSLSSNKKKAGGAGRTEGASAWSELNKLKF
jgi:uncharacterized metal-binding protein YceD (DUF177 family)